MDGEVHYYLAVNLGMAVEDSTIRALKNVGRILDHIEKAIKLAPDTDMGGPQRVLSMIYLKAPSWPNGMGDVDKAVKGLKGLCRRYPRYPLNHIFYAEALWEADGEDDIDEIRAQLDQAAALVEKRDWGYYRPKWLKQIRHMRCEYGILKGDACARSE